MKSDKKAKVLHEILVSVITNALLPFLLYKLLLPHMSAFQALAISVAVPLLHSGCQILRLQKPDAFGLFMLTSVVLSMAAMLIGHNERFLLIRESFVTGIMGFIFLASLLYKRPLIYYFAIKFTTDGSASEREVFEENWRTSARFRGTMRLMSVVCGLTQIVEFCVKIALAFTIPVSVFLLISSFVTFAFLGGAALWTVLYVKRLKRAAYESK